MTTKVMTGKVRFSYLNTFAPKPNDRGEDVWSTSLLISKDDKATVKKFNDAYAAEIKAKWGAKVPVNLRSGLRDGDAERPEDLAYKNVWFVNANSKRPVPMVDAKLNKVISATEWVSGDYGFAQVSLYPYEVSGNKGIACGLEAIQFTQHGEPLGTQVDAAALFTAVEAEEDDL